jgi:hypothetical protein
MSTARRWTTATTIGALSTSLRDNVICGVGMWGYAIHTAAAIWKVIWKLRLVLMCLS